MQRLKQRFENVKCLGILEVYLSDCSSPQVPLTSGPIPASIWSSGLGVGTLCGRKGSIIWTITFILPGHTLAGMWTWEQNQSWNVAAQMWDVDIPTDILAATLKTTPIKSKYREQAAVGKDPTNTSINQILMNFSLLGLGNQESGTIQIWLFGRLTIYCVTDELEEAEWLGHRE